MEFHICELQRLMTLTADPLTLRWLSEGVSRARNDLRRAKANRKARRLQKENAGQAAENASNSAAIAQGWLA